MKTTNFARSAYAAMGATILVQFAKQHGYTLTLGDAAQLIAGAAVAIHAASVILARYTPRPTQPASPAPSKP